MTLFCKKTAQVSNGILAVDVTRSKVPGIVHVDLKATPFAHFHVRSNDEGSGLGYNDSAGRFLPIALFADRKDADAALVAIQGTLMRPSLAQCIGKFALLLAGLFALLLIVDWFSSHARYPVQQAAIVAPPAVQAPRAGVPVDADSRFNDE